MVNKKENVQFEPIMARLRTILETIESEDRSLKESLRDYEEGVGLVRQAQEYLEAAEQRVRLLSDVATDKQQDKVE